MERSKSRFAVQQNLIHIWAYCVGLRKALGILECVKRIGNNGAVHIRSIFGARCNARGYISARNTNTTTRTIFAGAGLSSPNIVGLCLAHEVCRDANGTQNSNGMVAARRSLIQVLTDLAAA